MALPGASSKEFVVAACGMHLLQLVSFGMWALSQAGIKAMFRCIGNTVLTTRLPGKSPKKCLYVDLIFDFLVTFPI